MTNRFTADQRRVYLGMTDAIGAGWMALFEGNTDFYSAVYWDLLTRIWREGGPVRKTDAARFMNSVKSPHTAGKYIESAIKSGILIESDNPEDARSKLLSLSPDMREKLDGFFDGAVEALLAAADRVKDRAA